MVGPVERTINYKSRNDQYLIGVLSDTHFGAQPSDKLLANKQVDWVAQYCDAVILGGDYCEHITPKDRRFDWDTIDRGMATVDEQYEYATQVFSKLKGLDPIVVLDGNHDQSNWSTHNYVKRMAYDIGGEYVGYSGFTRLRFHRGKHRTKFDIYSHHGKTSARTRGGKVNKVLSMDQIFDADIYTMSHVHTLDSVRKSHLYFDGDMNIRERETYYVLTGGFLKGYEIGVSNYVEKGMYVPTSLGGVVIGLNCEKQYLHNVRMWDIPVESASYYRGDEE